MKIFFIVANISIIISLAYLIYFKFYISTKIYQKSKVTRFILSYLFRILAICSILFFIAYLFTLSIGYAICYIVELVLLYISLLVFFDDSMFGGCIVFVIWFILFFVMSFFISLNTYETSNETSIINLSSNSYYLNKGEVLIQFPKSIGEDEENIPYAIMEYDKDTVQIIDIPLHLELKESELEVTDEQNDRIEVNIIQTQSESIFSYFGFCKDYVESKITYKVYINQNNIKYH